MDINKWIARTLSDLGQQQDSCLRKVASLRMERRELLKDILIEMNGNLEEQFLGPKGNQTRSNPDLFMETSTARNGNEEALQTEILHKLSSLQEEIQNHHTETQRTFCQVVSNKIEELVRQACAFEHAAHHGPEALLPRVSFSASLSKTLHFTYDDCYPIPFDVVETNEGDGYSPVTGAFVAPFPGTYQFVARIVTDGERFSEFFITRNNKIIKTFGSRSIASVSHTMELRGQEEVKVEGPLNCVQGLDTNLPSMFGGRRLF